MGAAAMEGIPVEVVDRIAAAQGEPEWARALRRRSAERFARLPLPAWSGDLSALSLAPLLAAAGAGPPPARGAVDAPPGVTVVELRDAFRSHGELLEARLASVVPPEDNTFAALNGALWRSGWLVHVGAGVRADRPVVLPRAGGTPAAGVERILVVVEPGADVRIVEEGIDGARAGAPMRCLVAEVVVGDGAHCRYTSVQRWARDVYNLATRRAVAGSAACARWVDVNLGGRLTMQYPSVYFRGADATAEIFSLAFAAGGAHQDVGGKLVFEAPRCAGRIVSRMLADDGGHATFRPLVKVARGATGAECAIRADALRLGATGIVEAHPFVEIDEPDAVVSQGGTESRFDERELEARTPSVRAAAELRRLAAAEFLEPVLQELPAEHARVVLEVITGSTIAGRVGEAG